MVVDMISGTVLGTLILLFFVVNHWYSTREDKIEKDAQSEDD